MKTIDLETLIKVCELLEIDPNEAIEIHIELNQVTVLKRHALIRRGRG